MRDRSHPLLVLAGLSVLLSWAGPARGQGLGWRTFPAQDPALTGPVFAQIVHDDGSGPALYVAGDLRTPSGEWSIQRWNGVAFQTVCSGLQGQTYCFAVYDAGGGSALYAGTSRGVWRWDGLDWQALPSTPEASVNALCVWDDGSGPRLYATGAFASMGGAGTRAIAAWDGLTWSGLAGGLTWNSGVSGAGHSLVVHPDSGGTQLYVLGGFHQAGGTPAATLARWNGSQWSAVPGFTSASQWFDLASHDFGSGPELVVSGAGLTAGGQSLGGLAAWTGAAWRAIPGSGGSGFGLIESIDSGTGPVLYGYNSPGLVHRLCRWDGQAWIQVGAPVSHLLPCWSYGPATRHSLCAFDAGQGPRLHFASGSARIGDQHAFLARLEGNSWLPLGNEQRGLRGIDSDSRIVALASHDDGTGPGLFASGGFCTADGAPAGGVARWSGTGWNALPSAPVDVPDALIEHDPGSGPRLYAGMRGWIQSWDGATWSTLAMGSPAFDRYAALASIAGELFVGGTFTSIAGVAASNVARWDGAAWHPLAGGVLGRVYALAAHDGGGGPRLHVGGTFTSAGSVAAPYLATWDGSGWSALPSSVNGHVLALLSFDDGSGPALYAGGAFTEAGGAPAARVARWNGTAWSALGEGLNDLVTALAVFDDGSGPALYAGGDFTHSGANPASRIARWDGVRWSGLGAGVGPSVTTLAVHDDGTGAGPELFVGGLLDAAGVLGTNAIAAWRGSRGAISTACAGDGTLSACPCNQGAAAGRGCENSWATGGARLTASGSPAADDVVFQAVGLPPSAATLVFQGTVLRTDPFTSGDGLRCVTGQVLRLYVASAVGGAVLVPPPGGPTIRARSAALGDPLTAGAVRGYQAWYRDSAPGFCAPPQGGNWNVSNAVRIEW
ncbi:MAG: hypothetical protein JNK02_15300 [Planctomycetes bacterium]|nr:hypothetical protein [Planctomycetota bacterium]